MLDYIGIYIACYALFSLCLIVPPTEFVSVGLTFEYIFKSLIGQEHVDFVDYHLRRTALTVCAHSMLPLGFFIFVQYMEPSVNFFFATDTLTFPWNVALIVSVLLPIAAASSVLYWHVNDWSNHRLVKQLKLYDPNWRRVAAVINDEYRRVDKFTTTLGGVRRIVVTDSWVMVVSSYSVRLSQQADVRLTVIRTDEHALSHLVSETGQVGIQFVNILVENISKPIPQFMLRLDARDYRTLAAKLQAPLETARNVVIHQSLSERFVEAFEELVAQNPPFPMAESLVSGLEPCIGCMQETANVKLEKLCSDDAPVRYNTEGQPLAACQKCYCRPMWCVACMGRWFASRQDQRRTETWLAGKAPCPTCRATFCILDVCLVPNAPRLNNEQRRDSTNDFELL